MFQVTRVLLLLHSSWWLVIKQAVNHTVADAVNSSLIHHTSFEIATLPVLCLRICYLILVVCTIGHELITSHRHSWFLHNQPVCEIFRVNCEARGQDLWQDDHPSTLTTISWAVWALYCARMPPQIFMWAQTFWRNLELSRLLPKVFGLFPCCCLTHCVETWVAGFLLFPDALMTCPSLQFPLARAACLCLGHLIFVSDALNCSLEMGICSDCVENCLAEHCWASLGPHPWCYGGWVMRYCLTCVQTRLSWAQYTSMLMVAACSCTIPTLSGTLYGNFERQVVLIVILSQGALCVSVVGFTQCNVVWTGELGRTTTVVMSRIMDHPPSIFIKRHVLRLTSSVKLHRISVGVNLVTSIALVQMTLPGSLSFTHCKWQLQQKRFYRDDSHWANKSTSG